jgi:hypothetical protein
MSDDFPFNESFIKKIEAERKKIKRRNNALGEAIKKIDRQRQLRENSYSRPITY